MEIFIAKEAGACYGVNRSLEIACDASKKSKNVATFGPLIHNPLVVEKLRLQYGINKVENIDQAIKNKVDTLVIRSHGVTIDILDKANKEGLKIVDSTCPYVKKVQETAKDLAIKFGHVVVVGKAGHPEVESVCSYISDSNAQYYVLQSNEEIDKHIDLLKGAKTLGVVSQTTQSAEVFDNIVNKLKTSGLRLSVKNTICGATKKRQNAAEELSKSVDAFIVLGGYNSSNTNHLADICKKHCPNTFHIETFDDLNITKIKNCKKLGISAGASTPQNQIDELIEKINKSIK